MATAQAPRPKLFRNFVVFLTLFILCAGVLALYNSPLDKPKEIGLNELAQHVQQSTVKEIIVVEGVQLNATLTDDTQVTSHKEATDSLSAVLSDYGVTPEQLQNTKITVQGESGWKFFLVNILPILFPALIIVFFFWVMLRQVQGSNNRAMMFGQTRAQQVDPNRKNKTTFKDVAGATEAKEELMEVVDFLKNPKKFLALGARIPRGVLLVGSPGTGKTLLARAVAGEADAPFFHISGSEFVEMFVGVGASRVRDVFKKAKKAAPAILFIDEIDAVGRQRGSGMGGSHDEREQTLNQILTEMDGFEGEANVIVIAATNRPDVLDPALLRPGRFDRRVTLDLPDIREREEILEVHAKNKIFTDDVSLKEIAKRTTGFSGADLMNVLNEAAIFAARHDRKKVAMSDCLDAIDKVLLGPQKKNSKMSQKEKEITAYHEAGHALVAHELNDSDAVHKISIIPRGRAGGFTLKLPEEDRHYYSRAHMLADIAVSLGGYVSELQTFGDVTTGPSSDLEKATKVARRMVTTYGMSDTLGTRTFGQQQEMMFLAREIHEQRDYSDKTAQDIDHEVSRIISEQLHIAKKIVKEKAEMLKVIALKLLEVETLEREQFEALFAPQQASQESKSETHI
ncbi:MAG: ATP-dependent zinc metalloprotease FtsH [Candidatus Kerfeldbacteria bacterium]|nr:ATP-dependent zinc metalloprotease FtsH [Candidatus Kerfeldbacteria bacterium]